MPSTNHFRYELWQAAKLLETADEFGVRDLFRVQQQQGAPLEVRRNNGDGTSTLLAHVVGAPDELPSLLRDHNHRVPRQAANVMLPQQALRGLNGEGFAWVLNIGISAEGSVEEYYQVLWADNFGRVVMSVERSSDGKIVKIEKHFSPDDDHDFTITYGDDGEIIDIVEYIHDSDDHYFEDLAPMLTDLSFYANGLTLPSALGAEGRIPGLPKREGSRPDE
jgi:hypothetical protein